MPNIPETQFATLVDTLEFYGEDTSRRAVENWSCQYETEDGRRCAVGRLCKEPKLLPNFAIWDEQTWSVIKANEPEVANLEMNFLRQLQNMHDQRANWQAPKEMEWAVLSALDEITDGSIPDAVELFIGPFCE